MTYHIIKNNIFKMSAKRSKLNEENIQSIISPVLEKMTSAVYKEKPKNIVNYSLTYYRHYT